VASVETVRGPVPLEELGPTLMHEHVFIMQPEALQNYGHAFGPSYWDEEERVADGAAKLTRLRGGGIRTIVDPTVPGLGRYVPRVRRVAEAADLNVIVATGVYAFLGLPNFLAYRTADAIAELFIRELEQGINDTGIKAAFIKCAVEADGIVGDVPKVLEAVAGAAVRTGAPVMVHTNAQARTGLLALGALTGHGVDPSRIVIAHCGDSNDVGYLHEIASSGARLGCDRFGIDHFNPLPDRIRTLTTLLAEGYADRIQLGHDAACFFDFMIGDPFFANETADYLLISNQVLPALLEAGVPQEQIDRMLVENPQRFFSRDAGIK
jgi:phosphotriesterase-related protein